VEGRLVIRSAGKLGVAVLVAGAAACASLPDTTGYTTSTVQMKQAVGAAGDAAEAELRSAAALIPDDSDWKGAADRSAASFHEPWQKTVTSLDAMVSYAQSIEAIVGAGNHGAESATALAGSLTTLAEKVGVPVPGSAAVGAAVNTVAFIYGQIARAQAAHSLEEALANASPAISSIQTLVAAQVRDARSAFELATFSELQELRRTPRYQPFVEANQRLIAREGLLNIQISTMIANGGDPRLTPLQAQLEQAVTARARLAPHIQEFEARSAEVRTRERAGLAVFSATETALATWAASHENLVRAVREHRPVTMESLSEAVRDLRSLIQQWRAL
jgi:hypothetical protein